MKNFEEICYSVVKQPKFVKNATIGFILGLIPIINFFAFSYLIKVGKQWTENEELTLLDWSCVTGNLREVLMKNFFVGVIAFLGFILIPCLICFSVFGLAGLGPFGICIGLFISVPAFAYAAVSETSAVSFTASAILSEFVNAYRWVIINYKKLIIPSALFLCFQVVVSFVIPYALMGAPMFLGLLFIIAYVKQMNK
ncbi:MAG: hypothetical protein LBB16_00800 [Puniceicoccales bacterium]|jgi:hypothetical protein|nr:hypothetical protein [Puniceicoccales bacterium]